MREIKFRAWDKITTGMYYWIEIDREGYAFYLDNGKREGYSPFNSHLACLMQFTGLHDKNGKEIYEGDVLKAWHDEYEEEWVSVVGYKDCYFTLGRYWKDGIHDWYSMEQFESFELEIIGNVYENPELISTTFLQGSERFLSKWGMTAQPEKDMREFCYIVYKRFCKHMNNDFEKTSGEWEIKVDKIFKTRKTANKYVLSHRAGFKLRHVVRKRLNP